jgi:TP901 family phage tail tape measure protein
MKLAMATQGDHNALAKLTVQTIMGFGMTMEDSGLLVDKFAHAIQKSLIEWDDLASSVKFAMPFFVATGQSIDELLGGLEVLTNRALEAGIAGRGLRQALAQFAKHADDNASALGKLGVKIMDSEGNMRALHEITLDAQAAFGDITDLEALTAMLEDMNVRGATAFALLVQNADEFEAAVGNIANSAGEATLMADIQQQSLANQIQLVKNALLAPFLFADEIGEANDTLNHFTFLIGGLVKQFTEFFIITLPDGTQKLTEHSDALKDFVIDALEIAIDAISRFKDIFLEQEEGLTTFTDLLHMSVVPLNLMLDVLDKLGPQALAWAVKLKVLNSLLPITNILHMIGMMLIYRKTMAIMGYGKALEWLTFKKWQATVAGAAMATQGWREYAAYIGAATGVYTYAGSLSTLRITAMGAMVAMGGMITLFMMAVTTTGALSDVLLGLAIILALVAASGAIRDAFDWAKPNVILGAVLALGAVIAIVATMVYARNKLQGALSGMGSGGGVASGSMIPKSKLPTDRLMDSGGVFTGGRMYDSGGPTTEHGMAVLQRGETIIPKTRNMLDGGLTLNIGGDIITDNAEDFAERIAAVLPEALRRQSDIGGI